ncbi:MAG: hypothetical protein R6W31_07530 [Bacteroidales bacterium]
MDITEYLAFLPMLIYGIALADLFGQWKRFLRPKKIFLPYIILTIILTETAIYNVFVFAGLLEELAGQTYYSYLKYLIPPFLFMISVNSFTPDDESDTEEYFMKNMPLFFTLFALFAASHFFYDFDEKITVLVIRIIGILIIFLTGLFRKKWMINLVYVLWILMLIARG